MKLMAMRSDRGSSWVGKVVGIALALLLLGGVLLSSQYRSAAEGAAIASGLNPDQAFDPAAKAAELFTTIQAELPNKATDLVVLAPEVGKDLTAAGAQYGQDLGAGSYAFPVKVVGTVSKVDDRFLTLTVDGMGPDQKVVVPLAQAVNGGAVRDALGIIKFGDVPDQIAYQSVAAEMGKILKEQVIAPANVSSLADKSVTVYGAWQNGGPSGTWLIQPVQIEAAQ